MIVALPDGVDIVEGAAYLVVGGLLHLDHIALAADVVDRDQLDGGNGFLVSVKQLDVLVEGVNVQQFVAALA